jgi:hypothetical protein
MAIFPQGLSHVDARCNPGERRVLHQLKRCLEDDYLVWHDVPLGPRARQPDFVVLSPRWGVLLLEVKDWKRSTLVAATRDSVELATPRGRVTQAHPLRQARDYAMELADLMQRDAALVHADGPFRGRLLFPYGWGVVLAGLRRADVQALPGQAASGFDELFPPSRTLLRDELEDSVEPGVFQHRLWGMFTLHYPHTLSLPQRDRIRWHLFPEVRLDAQPVLDFGSEGSASPAVALPDLLQVMDLQQEQVARTLGEGHRVIHGAAGSGKTMILLYRAQQLARAVQPGRPILVLCFNRSLADRIAALLRQRGVDERVQVRTFHAWCQDLVRSYQIDVPLATGYQGPRRGDAWFEALALAVDRAVVTGLVPAGQYHALLIDEAHDFEDAWLRIAARMVDPATRSLLVLYDDAQSIYRVQRERRRKFNFSSVGIEARGRTSVLRLNYRNTAEVLALALQCAQGLLGEAAAAGEPLLAATPADDDAVAQVLPASAGRRGPLPVLLLARHALEEAELLAERLQQARAEGLALRDMALLVRTRQQMPALATALRRRGLALQGMHDEAFRRFDWAADSVKLLTLHSAKGLEFPLVAMAGLQQLPLRGQALEDELRLLYVGMTRATHRLLLAAHGEAGAAPESPVLQRVQAALAAMARQFPAESGP